jgi:hypothetical protein
MAASMSRLATWLDSGRREVRFIHSDWFIVQLFDAGELIVSERCESFAEALSAALESL